MKEFEAFLAKAIEHKDEFGSVNFLHISYDDRAIIDKLKKEGFIICKPSPTQNIFTDIAFKKTRLISVKS